MPAAKLMIAVLLLPAPAVASLPNLMLVVVVSKEPPAKLRTPYTPPAVLEFMIRPKGWEAPERSMTPLSATVMAVWL